MAMDLIADMERAAPSLAHSRLSLSCRRKIPGYVRILWVFKKLIGSEVSRGARLVEVVRPVTFSVSDAIQRSHGLGRSPTTYMSFASRAEIAGETSFAER